MPEKGAALLVLGQLAAQHAEAADLRGIASWMASHCGLRIAVLPDANSAAGWIAGCIPHRSPGGGPITIPGRDAARMTTDSLSGCVLVWPGTKPGLCVSGVARSDPGTGRLCPQLLVFSFRRTFPGQRSLAVGSIYRKFGQFHKSGRSSAVFSGRCATAGRSPAGLEDPSGAGELSGTQRI